ncbi:MAG: hypothetical protein OK474_02960 [Thaumarchaeota archaeon]|nr:hypothetical protein [Nitrososphaerota archaeon]
MTPESHLSSGSHAEANLLEAAKKASHLLEPHSLGVLHRNPLLDDECPEVSDVDLLSFWEGAEESPERITVEGPRGRVFVDILWIPVSAMLDPAEAASYKILPHLLLESETIWMRSESIRPLIENIKLRAYEKDVWERRIGHQIGFGDAALEEARKNLDFPPAALFFLQTAHSYYVTALADCLKRSTMSLLTRPVMKVRSMDLETRCGLGGLLEANLHLDGEPALAALKRVHEAVSARCADGQPRGVRGRTRGHFAYTVSPLELEYRVSVAEALMRRGDRANSNFYIRFWAYSLSRCPVVFEESRQGRNPSFYVPFRAFKESVQATCPEILDDMQTILGGDLSLSQAEESIEGTAAFRRLVRDQVTERGIAVTASREGSAAAAGAD